jgi:hypothetical protein
VDRVPQGRHGCAAKRLLTEIRGLLRETDAAGQTRKKPAKSSRAGSVQPSYRARRVNMAQGDSMTASYLIESTVDKTLLGADGSPMMLSQAEYDALQQAIGVIGTLWYLEESYDVLLQNAVEMETAVAHQAAYQRANVSSFPDEVDLEVRLLNRLLINFLASARAFVDSVQASLNRVDGPLRDKCGDLKTFFSEQFDDVFSYRLMEALRNHSQHRALPILQNLTTIRNWRSRGESMAMLSVSPQIERDALINNHKIRRKTRDEIAQGCEAMIDLMPHLAEYVRCFGKIVDKARRLYQPEYENAVATHTDVLKGHLADQWGYVWVTPKGDPKRCETLFTGAYDLRRLNRIRLRNVARDPEPT